MSNRYLYKAKSIDNGEWVTGYYVFCRMHHYILPNDDRSGEIGFDDRYDEWIEVDFSTLCQYTGRNDRNGKEIWENDILKEFNASGNEWVLTQIVFLNQKLNVGFFRHDIKEFSEYALPLYTGTFEEFDARDSEIVGNIFDNPELLEGCEDRVIRQEEAEEGAK